MDLQNLYFTSIFSLFIFVLIAKKLVTKKSNSTPNLPPGPLKLPIIGNIHNLIGSLAPHHKLRELSTKYGPLMHLKLGEVSTIVVSSPEYAQEVMKTHDLLFASRPTIQATKILSYDSLGLSFQPYGDYWRKLRKICTLELLSAKRVQSFQPVRIEELTNLIKLIASKERTSFNLSKEVLSTISTITARIAFGIKCNENEIQKFISVAREAIMVAGGFELGDLFPSYKWLQHLSGLKPRLEKLHKKADKILQKIIDEHREVNKSKDNEDYGDEVEEDLVDVLLKQDSLSDDSVKAVILDIFSAGSDATLAIIEWAMSELIKNPQIMQKAQIEVRSVSDEKGYVDEQNLHKLKYLNLVIKETMRLHAPLPLLLPRQCDENCKINGYEIPAKSKVIVNVWSIGRDSKYWVESEKFIPERFIDSSVQYKGVDFHFLPFGAGRRMCPGMSFGLANLEITLANLLCQFDWKMPNGNKADELDMTESFGLSAGRKHDLWLVPTTYHSSYY